MPPSCASVLSDSDASSIDGIEVEGDNSSNSLFPTSSMHHYKSHRPVLLSIQRLGTNCAAPGLFLSIVVELLVKLDIKSIELRRRFFNGMPRDDENDRRPR